MYSPSRAISQGCTQATPIYIKLSLILLHAYHHIRSILCILLPEQSARDAHIHMNKPFDVRSCIALLYKTAIPGATLKIVAWPRMNSAIIPRSLLGNVLHSRRFLMPTEVFLLYICVLTTLSHYAGGLGCEADIVTHSQ